MSDFQSRYLIKEFHDEVKSNHPMPKNTIGEHNIKFPVNVFTEFGNVNALILGHTGDTAQISSNDPLMFIENPDLKTGKYPRPIIERAQEMQNQIAEKLIAHGVHVIRPSEMDHSELREFEGMMLDGFHLYNARDLLLYYHDSVYDSPCNSECRVFESEGYDWILKKQREIGTKWYKTWKPIRNPDAPQWEAANFLRLGLDIMYLVSVSGSENGYWIIRKFFEERYGGKVRIHPVRNVYDGIHIDTTLNPIGFNKQINKFVCIVNPERVTPRNVPAMFRGKNWVLLETPKLYVHENY